jgi:predicted peptidase
MLAESRGPLYAFCTCVFIFSVLAVLTQPHSLTIDGRLASVGGTPVMARGAPVGPAPAAALLNASALVAPAARSARCDEIGPDGYQQCHFTDEFGQAMDFLLHVPPPLDPNQTYPLALVLHGGGERCSPGTAPGDARAALDAAPYVKAWVSDATSRGAPDVQSRWPSFVVVPELSLPNRWVDVPPAQGSYQLTSSPTLELQLSKEIVDTLRQQYADIDANRLYVTGISLGGYGTWDAIARWPGYFAAAAPVSGGGDPSRAAEMKDIPIWAFHGSADQIVPVSGSRDMVEAIRAVGGDPRYTEYPGAGHDIFATVYGMAKPNPSAGLFQWLFVQHKTGSDQDQMVGNRRSNG